MKIRTPSHRLIRWLRRHRDLHFWLAIMFIFLGTLLNGFHTLQLLHYCTAALLQLAFIASFIRVPSVKGQR